MARMLRESSAMPENAASMATRHASSICRTSDWRVALSRYGIRPLPACVQLKPNPDALLPALPERTIRDSDPTCGRARGAVQSRRAYIPLKRAFDGRLLTQKKAEALLARFDR